MKLDRPKAVDISPGDYPDKSTYDVCELKYDGIFGQLLIDDRSWAIWSRTGNLKRFGSLSRSWPRTLLFSEFIFGSEWSKDNPSLYGKLAVFSAAMIDGCSTIDHTNSDLRCMLLSVVDDLGNEDIEEGLFLVEQFPVHQAPSLWTSRVEEQKYEGLIFKNSGSMWSSGFGRMKANFTMDYVCMGFEESDSITYAGIGVKSVLGGLYHGEKLVQTCRVGGLTAEQREEFLDNPDRYIGRTFEAEGKKLSKRKSLRHPNFIRWRDDKDPKDCKF